MERRSFITGTPAVAGTGPLTGFAAFAEAHEGIDAVPHGSDAADIAHLDRCRTERRRLPRP
ncbi:hypothetical protein N0X72_00560 [Streptomyces carpaticus]|uniref:hypothetical protein n=1 Tax=Streptomyces carpaticus TaxID=285558 RepID=UPI0022063B1C|nr:hypothetical protein N0X72_00560 [Streptomyces carpaticus]